jgi:hypothetical protein
MQTIHIRHMAVKVYQQPKHVLPKRIWSFIYDQLELDVAEQRHLNVCMDCAEVFKLCVICENFDRLMRELGVDTEGLSMAA